MVWMGVPAALSNRLWARLRARNAVSSFMVFSKSARCSSLKGCTYLTIITSSGRGEYATKSGLTLMRYCISIVSKNFWSGTYYHDEHMPLYLLTMFGKGTKDNLTQAEQNALRRLVRTLIATRRQHHD